MARSWTLVTARFGFFGALAFAGYAAFAPARDAPRLLAWDKAEHFLAFYVLTGLCSVAFPALNLIAVAVIMSAIGAAIELIQALPFVQRDASVWDWVADNLAIAAALAPMIAPRVRLWLAGGVGN